MPAATVRNSSWTETLGLIPGYDSFATAGPGDTFDEAAANRACAFFERYLSHVKGELGGKPFRLELWQRALIGCIFGWKRPDGLRRYRECLLYVPRKNGKSTIAAGIALYLLCCDEEPGAEIYCAAAERDQAALVFGTAKEMVIANKELSSFLECWSKSIAYPLMGGSFKPISSKPRTKHGFNVHGVIADELHAHASPELVEALLTGMAGRRQPLAVHITTADYERPNSVCNDKHEYASKVRDGLIQDPAFLPAIYQAEREDDWTSPSTWAKANPNMGVSVSEEYLERECKRAIESPSFENEFKRLHLNLRTEQRERWITMAAWDACHGAATDQELAGGVCYGGLDLAHSRDFTAFVLAFPLPGRRLAVRPRFWIPKARISERGSKEAMLFFRWAQQGLISVVDGQTMDYEVVRRDINLDAQKYNIRSIGLDPWNAKGLEKQLTNDGFKVNLLRQGYASLSAPTKELETLYIRGDLAHEAHPVLRWMASNVAIERDAAGNIKPSRKDPNEKIDGIVALIMAINQWIPEKDGEVGSIYDRRDMVVL